MSITKQTTTEPISRPAAAGEVRIELYETAMCCQTGVCGPSVDQQLLTVRDDLRWAESQGATVERNNVTSAPDAFVANLKITGLMQAFGDQALPALVIDGDIRLHGRYPTRDDLAAALPPTAATTPAPGLSGCCSPGASC